MSVKEVNSVLSFLGLRARQWRAGELAPDTPGCESRLCHLLSCDHHVKSLTGPQFPYLPNGMTPFSTDSKHHRFFTLHL